MLQRMVKQVTTAAAARPARKRADSSSSSAASVHEKRRRRSRSESDAAASASSSTGHKPKSKPKSKVRTPLLEPHVIDEVYRALHGNGERRRARQQVIKLFAAYDRDDTQLIPAASFIKCIKKCGVRFKSSGDYDRLVLCFRDPKTRSDDHDEGAMVTYPAFVEFACNVRDSEALSEIALKLRKRIDRFEEENPRDSPALILAALKKLDKAKCSWIHPKRFAEFLLDSDRPSFKLKKSEVETIVERFEYEFASNSDDEDDSKSSGVDYVQFVQWLQPMQHINAKELHAQVMQLIHTATLCNGWDLDELFDAMDDDGNGTISRNELKQALYEMGLPLTDAQMERLVSEYDVDGDGRIQYREFISFFDATDAKKTTTMKKKSTKHQSSTSDQESTDVRAKRKQATRQKNTVRNTFSWGITKAFARKNAAKNHSSKRKTTVSSKQPVLTSSDEDESESQQNRRKGTKTQRKKQPKDSDGDSTSSQEERAKRHNKKAKTAAKKQVSSSEDDSMRGQRPAKKSKRPKRKQTNASTSEDSSTEPERKPASRKKKVSGATDEEQKGGESTTTTSADVALGRNRRLKSSSPTKKSKRKLSTVSKSHRDYPHTPSSRSHARRHSQFHHSPRRSHRRQSATSMRKSRHRSNNADHRAWLHSTGGRRHQNTVDSKSSAGSDRQENASSSSSGIDVDQIRRIKQINPGPGDHSDSGDQLNNTDAEYEKHLKRSLRRAFDFFDLDRSEMIEKRELNTVLRALGHEFTHEELDTEMNRADLDNNGHLDFDEFVKFVKRQLAQKAFLLSKRREMEIRQAFQSLDSDKNGVLDEKELEYLVYKVLQVELSVEELDALLDFVDGNGDGTISEEEFITFMKVMEEFYKHGGGTKKQARFLFSLDGTSKLACAAMKKLVRGGPMDLDRSLLAFFGIPTNYRPAISSAATCRLLQSNTIEHALSFPSPKTIMALAQDLSAQPKLYALGSKDNSSEEWLLLQQAEIWQHHAILSIKRAAGVPRPFDAREEDVVKRCVHVCLYQEQEEKRHLKPSKNRKRVMVDAHHENDLSATARSGAVVGNVHEIPVHWHADEEDVWQFSKKATKEDKYKFLVRTNSVNDHLYLLVELIVHLRMGSRDNDSDSDDSKRKKAKKKKATDQKGATGTMDKKLETREMVCCWCKIPLRTLLAKRSDIFRSQEKLWGGTAHVPVDIEHDEILRRRSGWRAVAKMFQKPIAPCIGVKSAPIERFPDELQKFVQLMPPTIIAPFVSIPILAEYMTLMETMLSSSNGASAGEDLLSIGLKWGMLCL